MQPTEDDLRLDFMLRIAVCELSIQPRAVIIPNRLIDLLLSQTAASRDRLRYPNQGQARLCARGQGTGAFERQGRATKGSAT